MLPRATRARATRALATLAAALCWAGGATAQAPDTLPGTIAARALPGGGSLAFYRQPASAVVAIRLSFALPGEDPRAAALARVAVRLLQPELERRAGSFGARVALERSAARLSVSVVGAAADAAALATAVREVLTQEEWSAQQAETARLIADADARREAETPEPLLRRRLTAAVFPALADTLVVVPAGIGPATMRRFCDRTFTGERLQAVVVGPMTPSQAEALLGRWPETLVVEEATPAPEGRRARPGAGAPAGRRTARPAPAPPPEVVFPWAALAWRTDADAAAVAVAARLVGAQLSAAGLRGARAELWWGGDERALVVLGSRVTADSTGPGTAALLAGAVADAGARAGEAEVAAARRALARDVLFSARTPDGLARYLGEMFERTGEAAAGQRFLYAVDATEAATVKQLLEALGEARVVEVKR